MVPNAGSRRRAIWGFASALFLITAAVPGSASEGPSSVESKSTIDELSLSDWEHMLAAPTLGGPSGLLRVLSARSVRPRSVRVGVHFEGFRTAPFLFSTPRDDDFRLGHRLGVVAGGPNLFLLRQFELYVTFGGNYNRNHRVDPGRHDAEAITSIAHLALGLKAGWDLGQGLTLGGRLGLRLVNSPIGKPFKLEAMAMVVDALGSWDLQALAPRVPLRLHLNLGGDFDNSYSILSGDPCPTSTSIDACIRSRAAAAFAYQLSQSQLRVSVGLEAPFRFKTPSGFFGVSAVAEYHGSFVVEGGDATFARALAGANSSALSQRMSHVASIGARLRPGARFVIDVGVDLGLVSPSLRFGAKVPPWLAHLSVSYSYDPEPVRGEPPEVPPVAVGSLRLILRSAGDAAALANVRVVYPGRSLSTQLSDEAGEVTTYPLPEGAVVLELRSEGFETTTVTATVQAGREGVLEVSLQPLAAASQGSVSSIEMLAPATAPAELPASVPSTPHVERDHETLQLSEPILFVARTTALAPESQMWLDEVAAYLLAHATAELLSIEAHTDNSGVASRNLKVSADRAQAVMTYLIGKGVPAARLQARGFGGERPLVPNLSPKGRASNRRIELRFVSPAASQPSSVPDVR